MKIKLSDIKAERFVVRKQEDKDHLSEIKESLKVDGQWDPILVRPGKNNGGYELISGHTRFHAAKELGWKELEATVKDLADEEADILALKTNLMRKDMSELEEGEILQKYAVTYNLTQEALAKKVGKSGVWVTKRLSLVLRVIDDVKKALSKGLISSEHASLISTLSKDRFNNWEDLQKEFLGLILKNKWSRDETRLQLKLFLNRTIYTIGYSGRDIDQFINVLKENNIDFVIDIRSSDKSENKPEFNGPVLSRSLKQAGIGYQAFPELGVHYMVAQPYKDGYIKDECFFSWYRWNIEIYTKTNIEQFTENLKKQGKCALLCVEATAIPSKKQVNYCHRDVLAKMVMDTKQYSERIDL